MAARDSSRQALHGRDMGPGKSLVHEGRAALYVANSGLPGPCPTIWFPWPASSKPKGNHDREQETVYAPVYARAFIPGTSGTPDSRFQGVRLEREALEGPYGIPNPVAIIDGPRDQAEPSAGRGASAPLQLTPCQRRQNRYTDPARGFTPAASAVDMRRNPSTRGAAEPRHGRPRPLCFWSIRALPRRRSASRSPRSPARRQRGR